MTKIGLTFKHWPLITVQRSCKVCGDYMTGTACDTRSIYFGSTSVCEGGKDFCMTDLIHDSSGSDKIFKRCFCLLPLLRANSFTTYSRIVLVYSKKYLKTPKSKIIKISPEKLQLLSLFTFTGCKLVYVHAYFSS